MITFVKYRFWRVSYKMSQELPSSDIRELLFQSEVSDVDSHISIDDFPDEVDLEDFSSGSGDVYFPESTELDSSSDSEDVRVLQNPRPSNTTVQQRSGNVWVRVYPPEPEIYTTSKFSERHPGIRNCPPRNSKPIRYFYLFFTNAIWNLMVNQTNLYTNREVTRKRVSG